MLVINMGLALQAQIDLGNRVKSKVNQRIQQRTDQAIDKALDKTEEGIKDGVKKKEENKNSGNGSGSTNNSDNQTSSSNSGQNNNSNGNSNPGSFKSYSKYDFVPGEKVLYFDDLSNVEIGDLPADWNANTTAEVVTVEGRTGKFLKLSKAGVVTPELINNLPDNFTLEFDVLVNNNFSFYSPFLYCTFGSLNTAKKEKYTNFGYYATGWDSRYGVRFGLHPEQADYGLKKGRSLFINWTGETRENMRNETDCKNFHKETKNYVRVSIWRQKERIRIYVNDEKIYDIPKAFVSGITYNCLTFAVNDFKNEDDAFYIGNFKLAIGAPDTRNKLAQQGKYSTTGILFDLGSDKVKPQSYGTIKEIATILTENPTMKVKIVGHTDADGDDKTNLELSKKRADAVKNILIKEFAIAESRLSSDGKGETEPAAKNDTPSNKAQNRRVEFIKVE